MKLSAHGVTVDISWDDPTDHIPRRIQETGDFYERPLLDICFERAREGPILDVGAHIGNHALWFGAVMNRPVWAWEPSPSFTRLEHNIQANNLQAQVNVFREAVGVEGWGELVAGSPGNTGSATIRAGAGPIPIHTLDSYQVPGCGLLKVDVEGGALAVLEGATEVLGLRPFVCVETGESTTEIGVLLAGFGYKHVGQVGVTPVHMYEVP